MTEMPGAESMFGNWKLTAFSGSLYAPNQTFECHLITFPVSSMCSIGNGFRPFKLDSLLTSLRPIDILACFEQLTVLFFKVIILINQELYEHALYGPFVWLRCPEFRSILLVQLLFC